MTARIAGDLEGAPNTTITDCVYVVDPLTRGITMAGAAVGVPSTKDRLSGSPPA